ncbi:conserved hypothetical protein [Frankia canadensis]|uniref:MarR family transcriptional regulator n=1 Tax=Frankia canadensis TaxID=1836972 RepID=A0A2I2KR23_9ACTN|nr:MarR family transcriptional regulator [Frankia canadensis]SNQ48118.1 conserved hypothetical protein [Frankia canadensis]SOU55408.1 conserved hypothetical protein [Frankia canadensis]
MDDDPLLGYQEIAAMANVKPVTIRGYRRDGRFPPPDDLPTPDRPRWYRSTVLAWLASRPGQGARTDRKREDHGDARE